MPRVIGIDPGTVSIDLCGLDNGRLFLDRSWPTAEALADPAPFVAELDAAGPLDLVVGPSGYGVPITRVQDITEEALRLAFLAAPGETGGIGGLRNRVRARARTRLRSPPMPPVSPGAARKARRSASSVMSWTRVIGNPYPDGPTTRSSGPAASSSATKRAGSASASAVGQERSRNRRPLSSPQRSILTVPASSASTRGR